MLRSRHLLLLAGSLVMIGCRQDMHNQPRYKPLAGTDFFGDGRSARPVVGRNRRAGPPAHRQGPLHRQRGWHGRY